MFQAKRVFKIVSPITRRDGGTYWMACGNGYPNRDGSINLYIDALPMGQKDGLKLQLRELTEDELRERAEKRASYQARGTIDPNLVTGGPTQPAADRSVPF